jgi:hypothetical protein
MAFRGILTRRRLFLLAALVLLSPAYTLYGAYYLFNPSYPPAHCALPSIAPRIRFHQLAGCQFNNQLEEILWAHYAAHTLGRALEYTPLKRQQWVALNDRVPITSYLVLDASASCEASSFVHYPEADVERAREAGYTVIDEFLPFDRRLERLQTLIAAHSTDISLYIAQRTFEWNYLTDPSLRSHIPSFLSYLRDTLHLRFHPRITLPSFLADYEAEPYLAAHFRRGDFAEHCENIWARRIPPVYMATHAAGALPPAERDAWERALDSEAGVRDACYPSVAAFAALVRDAAARHGLQRVHILHNAGAGERAALLGALRMPEGPGLGRALAVSDSADVPLPVRDRVEMGITVDMLIATRAAVFMGNRWSSVGGNVAVMRAVEGREAGTTFY